MDENLSLGCVFQVKIGFERMEDTEDIYVVVELGEACRCERDCKELDSLRKICRASKSGFVQGQVKKCGWIVQIHDKRVAKMPEK
jgi:hypothetical protein